MTEQMGTPGSNADTSVNGSKLGASKDKQCPFCHQGFTSSSLGRHLDLYIKEKNPKPADGIHIVDEIRKMRGGITRRQPRNSTSRREDSTPAVTPGALERRSPGPESYRRGDRSPSLRREPPDLTNYCGRPNWHLNKGTWETTGVMNTIPATRNGDLVRSRDKDDQGPRIESRSRSVSKQILSKTAFQEKLRLLDALDNAKAAELALREMLGAFRAAKQRVEGPSIFDYDPLSLDFPSLILQCLPPPPTLYQCTPVPTSTSWSILPPGDQQYEALRTHFSAEFRRWRVASAIATTAPQDDLSYPPQQLYSHFDDPSVLAQRAEEQAAELESKISEHIHNIFAHWNSLPAQKRSEFWILSLARSVGHKSDEVEKLKKEKELAQQQAEHLRLQVDELSRLQHPREFKLVPPSTLPLDSKTMTELGEMGLTIPTIGYNPTDRSLQMDAAVEQKIARWREVVREARGGTSGLAGQRSFSGDSSTTTQPPASTQLKPNANQNQGQNKSQNINHTTNTIMTNGVDMGSDQDADADADMEEDDSYAEMIEVPPQRVPEAPMTQSTNFRLTNGNSNQGGTGHSVIDGLENQTVVQGYVRIGA